MKCPKCHTENLDTSRYCADCGTQLLPSKEIPVTETLVTPTEELTRGTTFTGRYEIIEELGKGGMAKVYRVEDKKLNEEVALKIIKPEIASDKKTIERFSNSDCSVAWLHQHIDYKKDSPNLPLAFLLKWPILAGKFDL